MSQPATARRHKGRATRRTGRETRLTAEFMNLVAAFFLCNAEAEIRVLSAQKAHQCLGYQTAIKVELMEDVSLDDYAVMTTAERAAFGRRGYEAYLGWKAANPDLVRKLESEARKVATAKNS